MSQREATIYPYDALAAGDDLDVISMLEAPTLDRLFRERVSRSADRVAYTDYDFDAGRWRDYTWRQMAVEVARWQTALAAAGLRKGDHVGIRLRNCRHWVIFDQAALGLGLVVVPLYINDRADNANYVLDHAGVKLLLVGTLAEWQELDIAPGETPGVEKVIVVEDCDTGSNRVVSTPGWLPENSGELARDLSEPEELASIVYTSGTTGRPKGVMLSHTNLISNSYAGLRSIVVAPDDVLLSFLPLSHALERTVGYYAPLMAGARVAFTRSIQDLAEDMMDIRPTVLITVPRIFERIFSELNAKLEQGPAIHRILFDMATRIGWDRFQWRQGRGNWKPGIILWPLLDRLVAKQLRDRLGGRLTLAVVGGAPLSMAIAKTFIPLGIDLLQGYGLTECSPILCTNTLRQNRPETIGLPLHGVRLRIGEHDELLARGPNIMMGYWRNAEATSNTFVDGWLATGDQARIDGGFISLTGRIKDILVLANGEKVPPADMESAIAEDALFEQSMVIGEQMPYLSALVVLNKQMWTSISGKLKIADDDDGVLQSDEVEQFLLERIRKRIREFPGYARIRHVTATLDPWTVENDLITPTLKLKRSNIRAHHEADINRMYEGHDTFRND